MIQYRWLVPLLMLAACGKSTADPAKPESYAIRLAVEPGPGGPEQRVALPVAAQLALRNATNSDLRLFDATGRSLPLAIFEPRIEATSATAVAGSPMLGRQPHVAEGLEMAIGPDRVARITTMDGTAGPERPVAALLDTRMVAKPASALNLDVEIPAKKLITLTIAASSNLSTWDILGEQTLFRADGIANPVTVRIALGDIPLKDRYLRVSWGDAEGVAIASAEVLSRSELARPPQLVAVKGLALTTPHQLDIALPSGEPPAALRLRLAGGEGVVPLRYAMKSDSEGPWVPSGAATLRSDAIAVLQIDPGIGPLVRITADKRTPGFAVPPRVELVYEPVELVTRFSGRPPYRLAAGLESAPGAFLAVGDIVASADPSRLPQATIETQPVPAISLGASESFNWRKAGLWAVLLLATATLALAVVRLMKGG